MRQKSPSENVVEIDRAQTGVGAAYSVTFVLLIVSGVLAFGYVYVSTPAISATDKTAEASTLSNELITDRLAIDETTSGTTSGAQLDPEEVDDFFSGSDIDGVRVADENDDLKWNVSLTNRDSEGETIGTIGDETPIGGVSEYQTAAILDGDVVIMEVTVWQDQN